MRAVTNVILASVLVAIAGCSSKKDYTGSEPRYKLQEQRWNSSWLVKSNVSMWQTYTSEQGPESIHSTSKTELLITPAGLDPNGNRLVAVSFQSMEVSNDEVTASSSEILSDEDAAVSDEDIAKGRPYNRIGMIKVLKEVCRTTITCRVTPEGRVEYVSGDDIETRLGGTISALGNMGLHFVDYFCARTAISTLKGENDILPLTPAGSGARWHLTTTDLSANTKNLPCNVFVRLKSIRDSDGGKIADIVFSSEAGDDSRKEIGSGKSMVTIVGRRFSVSGQLEFALDKNVCRMVKTAERGKIIAEVGGERRQKRFTRDVTTTLTEVTDLK